MRIADQQNLKILEELKLKIKFKKLENIGERLEQIDEKN